MIDSTAPLTGGWLDAWTESTRPDIWEGEWTETAMTDDRSLDELLLRAAASPADDPRVTTALADVADRAGRRRRGPVVAVDAVRDAVTALPAPLAELVRLVHWDGFTIESAAEHLGIPASTARGRYQRAKALLREALASV